MKQRNIMSITNSSLLLGIFLIMVGGTAMVKAQGKNDLKAMEGSLVTTYKTEALVIPPIDSAAPSDIETASFGLG